MTIPDHLVPTVERALHAAFGTTTCDDVAVLGGVRAFICLVVVRGQPYVVRIGAAVHPDPEHEIAATRAAVDAGLAPRVWHADVTDRVMVSDFVAPVPLPAGFGVQLAPVIARIHALPLWPRKIHQVDMVEGFVAKLRVAGVRAGDGEVFDAYAEVTAHYPRDADLVACHNDLKAPNLLYDGARTWVIDWEAAFVNDRYADLANAACFFVEEDDREEAAFLAAYFGAPPTAHQRARLVVARFVNHVGYVAFPSLADARASVPAQPAPDYRAFHDDIIAGTVDLTDQATRARYAEVHLAAARRALGSPRLTAAAAVLAERSR
jgi:hypothetical protein